MRDKQIRVGAKFAEELTSIREEARKLGLPRSRTSDRNITEKLAEDSMFRRWKEQLLEKTKIDLDMAKKFRCKGLGRGGALTDMFIFVAFAFVVVLGAALFIYVFGLIAEPLENLPAINNPTAPNVTGAISSIFSKVNEAVPQLHFLAAMAIFGVIIMIFISNFLVRAHPAFFIAYIIVLLIAVFVSIQITIAYDNIASKGDGLGNQLREMGMTHFIMTHLPIWTTIVGAIGALFLYIGITRDSGLGGTPV